MPVKIFHRYNTEASKPVILSSKVDDEFKVQQYGVMSVECQVARMVMSGQKLEDFRMRNMFNSSADYPKGVDTDDELPCERIRDLNYDLTDLSNDLEYLAQAGKPVAKEEPVISPTPIIGENNVVE